MKRKIKLIIDLPIEGRHGMTKGRVLDVVRGSGRPRRRDNPAWYVMGDVGEEVGVLRREAHVVD